MEFDITQWNRISEDAFKNFAYDAGVIVKNFDPTQFEAPDDEDIVCTTTGNITASMVPTMSNLGDDVNGVHGQFKELEILESWVATLGFTALETGVNQLKLSLGAADVATGNAGVKPRMYIKNSDFETIALIMFKIGGGMCAVVVRNALSTGGLSITTSKSGKANLAVTMTGFQSMSDQSTPAMEFYEADSSVVPDIVLNKANISLTAGDNETLTATTSPEGETVSWSSSNTSYATVSNGVVHAVAAGTATITASITVDGTTYSDTCTVKVAAASST